MVQAPRIASITSSTNRLPSVQQPSLVQLVKAQRRQHGGLAPRMKSSSSTMGGSRARRGLDQREGRLQFIINDALRIAEGAVDDCMRDLDEPPVATPGHLSRREQ